MTTIENTLPQLSGEAEARAFWRLRRRMLFTTARQAVSRGWLRLVLVVVLSAILWMGLFGLFAEGFQFLKVTITIADTHDQLVRAVFGMFVAALMVMLVFSTGIILYGSLFHSAETAFLMTNPVREERIFLHKFQEAMLLSSWGFLLMGSPMLVAYGVVAPAPWYYYAILVPLMVAFVYIPAGIGAIACLLAVRCFPGGRTRLLLLPMAVVVALMAWFVWSLGTGRQSELLTPGWFREMIGRLEFAQHRLLPSWWLSTGLLEAARGVWSQSVLFLTTLIANALIFRQLSIWFAARLYRRAYTSVRGKNTRDRRKYLLWLDNLICNAMVVIPRPMRLLIVKDLRLFRRDPLQWSQFFIFFGLLGLYFVNIREFSYSMHFAVWVKMISFLNLAVVGLLMSTFTTRFVFPLISLEGRYFWTLGLLPLRRDTILWSKFLFATGGSFIPCSGLVLLSDVMLDVSAAILWSHQMTCVFLCVGLSGIAVGLGSRLPSLRETSPSRIAAGFGGTLNLMISTLYIMAVVILTAVPCHFGLIAQKTQAGSNLIARSPALQFWLQSWLGAGTLASLLLAVLVTVIPMRMGFNAFRRMEF
jgi:ABC-2 type transport system permease protein